MSELKGNAVCLGCSKVVDRNETINEHELCNSCQYEHEAKLDNLTDEE